MKKIAVITSLCAWLAAAAWPPAHAAPDLLRVQQVDILDRHGFEKPLVAATALVPAGWRAEGGVQWLRNPACGEGHRFAWQASAPDGSASMQVLPGEAWGANNFGAPAGGCPQASASDARQYLGWFVQRQRPGARIVDYRPRPELSESLNAMNQNPGAQAAGLRTWVDAGEVLLASTGPGGRAMREVITAVASFTHTRMASLGAGPAMETLQGSLLFGFAYSAPEGALDFRTADALRSSIRPGPEWQARMRKSADERFTQQSAINAQIGRDTLNGIVQRGQIATQTRDALTDMRHSDYRARSQSSGAMHRDNIHTLREVQPYHHPGGGTVVLSAHYKHAWQLKDGSYVLTDSPSFDPNRELGLAGQELKRSR